MVLGSCLDLSGLKLLFQLIIEVLLTTITLHVTLFFVIVLQYGLEEKVPLLLLGQLERHLLQRYWVL